MTPLDNEEVVYGINTLSRNTRTNSQFIEEDCDFEYVPAPKKRPSLKSATGVVLAANALQNARKSLRPTSTKMIPMSSTPVSSRASTLNKKKVKTKNFIDDLDSDPEL